MPPKSTEKNTSHKKESPKKKNKNFVKDTAIIETTYEKVLSIINHVKDLIKKYSKNSQKLIDDLEWVIKVISNKSLYSYEVKKSNLSRQNSEYNKFVNFFTKYNEEVIGMNKRHILVSGLMNLVKKGEIMIKPSLRLKRILPEELQNMDYKKELEKKNRKKNFINLIGNAILNLYYRTLEERKKKNNDNIESERNEDNNGKKEENENEKDKHKEQTQVKMQKIRIIKNTINHKKIISDIEKKNNFDSDSKLINFNSSYSKRKTSSQNFTRLTKNEKRSLYSIKNAMENYYSKYVLNEHTLTKPLHHFIIKNNFMKWKNKKKINKNCNYLKNNSTYMDKSLKDNKKINLSFRNKKIEFDDEDKSDKNKSTEIRNNDNKIFRNKIKKNTHKHNHIFSTDFNTNKNISYITKNSKKLFSKKIQISEYKKNKSTHFHKINGINKNNHSKKKINNSNLNNNNQDIISLNDNNKKNNEDKISIKKERAPLNTLINQYFDDMKMIYDKDFDIFEFKSKVGYKNVLPLMCHCMLSILGLLDNRIMPLSKIESFLYSVSDNYKESTLYHNSLHGADVTQSLFVYFINTNAEQICETNVLDLLGMMISAMGHDLGHPGLTNNFHINASTDLAITYNDASCLENYHCSYLFRIIKKDETNIFEKLSVDNYKNIRKRMISQILATDMANHGEVISLIRTKIKKFQEQEEEGIKDNINNKFILLTGNEKTKFEEQQVLLNYLIHCADLGHNCKKYEISKKWIKLLCEEFWIQGDKEKSLGIPVSFLCDRDKIDVPSSQVGFLKGFIFSTFDSLVEIFPPLKFTMDNAKNNMSQWQLLLDQKRATGWTPKKEKNDENEKDDEL